MFSVNVKLFYLLI